MIKFHKSVPFYVFHTVLFEFVLKLRMFCAQQCGRLGLSQVSAACRRTPSRIWADLFVVQWRLPRLRATSSCQLVASS